MLYVAFYKPYGVVCQFSEHGGDKTLSNFDLPKNIYAAGRLDKDSEGLLLLSDDGEFIHKVSSPKFKKPKTYWAQVDHLITESSLIQLRQGIQLKGYKTKPAKAKRIEIEVPPRVPPIRVRKNIPTSWIELVIHEGKNRQVRKMTAAVGHPTLRLIRVKIGDINLDGLEPGMWRELSIKEKQQFI